MADILNVVDIDELRHQVRQKYRDVAADPSGTQHIHHFHTGRTHAVRLGYPGGMSLRSKIGRISPVSSCL